MLAMEIAIERMTGLAFLAVGLSYLLRPHEWVEFFAQLRAKGAPGAFINGMMSLSFGTIIVGFHGTQWSGWAMLVTMLGWGQVVKGFIHICFPAHSLRSYGAAFSLSRVGDSSSFHGNGAPFTFRG